MVIIEFVLKNVFFFWVVPIIFCVVFVFLKMLFTFYGLYVKWEKMFPIWNLKRPILQIYIQWCSCGWRNVCPVAGRFWILHCFLLFEVFFFNLSITFNVRKLYAKTILNIQIKWWKIHLAIPFCDFSDFSIEINVWLN